MHRSGLRALAVIAATVAIGAITTPSYATVVTHNSTDVGLFGASDPTYDGAFRQSLGLLAEAAAGVHDTTAIHWLVAQQCPDGGWTAYRSSLSTPCPATNLTTFTGEDSNSTALAMQALHALGVTPTHDPLPFLHSLQDSDGGFPLLAGSGTDPNSTGLVVQALSAVGQDPAGSTWTVSGHDAVSALQTFWLNCGSSDPGAYSSPYSSGHGDLLATVQAIVGAVPKPFPFVGSVATTQPAPDCTGGPISPTPSVAATYAATWLAGKLQGGGYLTSGSSPDYSLTAQGVLAMAASGTNKTAATTALNYLATNVDAAVLDPHGALSAGSLGYLALAAHSLGQSVTSFGGRNLITLLQSTRRALPVVFKPIPPLVAAPAAHPTKKPATLPATGRASGVELGLAGALIGAGLLLQRAGRRRRT